MERQFYAGMEVHDLVYRLLTKRPIVFYLASDSYLLQNLKSGSGGFERVKETRNGLDNLQSYDEQQLSALLSMTSSTIFINDGSRGNCGRKQPYNPLLPLFQRRGVLTGCIGARFEKPNYMEWQHVMVTEEQNTVPNGYGAVRHSIANSERLELLRVWATFYGVRYFPTYSEVQELRRRDVDTFSDTYIIVPSNSGGPPSYFNKILYFRRMRLSIAPFLRDANKRVQLSQYDLLNDTYRHRSAHCVAVGLGLGAWLMLPQQVDILLAVYADILSNEDFPFISDLTFNWFSPDKNCGGSYDGENFSGLGLGKNKHIRIHFNNNNPNQVQDEGTLLVVQYAWDSNRYSCSTIVV